MYGLDFFNDEVVCRISCNDHDNDIAFIFGRILN